MSKKLHIENIPSDTEENDVREAFEKFGKVVSVDIRHEKAYVVSKRVCLVYCIELVRKGKQEKRIENF